MRVKVESPKELGPSYAKGDILEVSADKAARWKAQGLVSYVDPGSQDAKKPTKAEVEEEPRGGDAAPVFVVHPGGEGDPATAVKHEGERSEDLSPDPAGRAQAPTSRQEADETASAQKSEAAADKKAAAEQAKQAKADAKAAKAEDSRKSSKR